MFSMLFRLTRKQLIRPFLQNRFHSISNFSVFCSFGTLLFITISLYLLNIDRCISEWQYDKESGITSPLAIDNYYSLPLTYFYELTF